MEVSCHDLVSSSEKKSSVALANSFRAAHRYISFTCMLMLFLFPLHITPRFMVLLCNMTLFLSCHGAFKFLHYLMLH